MSWVHLGPKNNFRPDDVDLPPNLPTPKHTRESSLFHEQIDITLYLMSIFFPDKLILPFDTLASETLVTGSPLLPQCRTWIDCEVLRRVDIENAFEFFVGTVVGIRHEGEIVEIDQEISEEVE